MLFFCRFFCKISKLYISLTTITKQSYNNKTRVNDEKKTFISTSVAVCCTDGLCCSCETIHSSTNCKIFFAAKGKVLKTTNAAYAPQRRLKSATKEVAPYYVFNAGNNNGFVIVSGDDRIQPILGYVDSGSFDLNKIPDNMRDFLKTYSEQVAELMLKTKQSVVLLHKTLSNHAEQ